mmetsp:Transcript_29899/g.69601  ORF Transcript_29899/g.69601 Transcript_29899/m.69601 type:complete len:203 (+) Transcript_29899:382-990(+)
MLHLKFDFITTCPFLDCWVTDTAKPDHSSPDCFMMDVLKVTHESHPEKSISLAICLTSTVSVQLEELVSLLEHDELVSFVSRRCRPPWNEVSSEKERTSSTGWSDPSHGFSLLTFRRRTLPPFRTRFSSSASSSLISIASLSFEINLSSKFASGSPTGSTGAEGTCRGRKESAKGSSVTSKRLWTLPREDGDAPSGDVIFAP